MPEEGDELELLNWLSGSDRDRNLDLGWQFRVYRLIPGVSLADLGSSSVLAGWTTGPSGRGWLDDLVEKGRAADVGGHKYVATAKHILRTIPRRPPAYVDRRKMAACPRDAQLVVIARERWAEIQARKEHISVFRAKVKKYAEILEARRLSV